MDVLARQGSGDDDSDGDDRNLRNMRGRGDDDGDGDD